MLFNWYYVFSIQFLHLLHSQQGSFPTSNNYEKICTQKLYQVAKLQICLICLRSSSNQFAVALYYFQVLEAEFVFALLRFQNLVAESVFALLSFKNLTAKFALAL